MSYLKLSSLAATLTLLSPLAMAAADFEGNPIPGATNIGDWANNSITENGWGAGVSFSTLGIGGHLTYEVNNKFYLKGEIQGLAVDKDIDIDEVNYDSKLDFFSAGITANYLPFGKGLRFSFGGYAVNNNIKVEASSPGEVIIIGNTLPYTLQAGDTLNGEVDYSTFAPYLGLGWDWAWGAEKQYILSLDAGILFTGTPDVTLTPNSALLGSIPQSAFDSEIQDIADDLDEFKYYPVFKLGFTWEF